MDLTQHQLQPCINCGNNVYHLIDGYYYCEECNERLMFVVAFEQDEFANLGTQKSTIKVVDAQKKQKQNEEENQLRRTSYEEYNFILHGLTNEILELENIPNFKVTVLQLWITYLKSMEAGFVDQKTVSLPKFFIHHRQADAEILYNKKPKPKKKYPRKKLNIKKEGQSDLNMSMRDKRREMRKGLKALDMSETSASSTSLSSIASMSIEDIASEKNAQELNIEYSGVAKDIRKKIIQQKERLGKELKFDEHGDVKITFQDLLNAGQFSMMLNEKTLIFILYAALNICESRIQLGDLLRFTREGQISFYNFLQHIPEMHREQLSLMKGQTFAFNNTTLIRQRCFKFVSLIPDLRTSLKTPNIKSLVHRYLKELSLPDELSTYIDRLLNIFPPSLSVNKFIPNYEARAVAYIVFTLKVIFGIDGYREIEISKSAKKFNRKLSKRGIESEIFVYEEWREFIAYRNVLLSKYYYPFILSPQYQGNKPYEQFIELLNHVKPEVLKKKKKSNILDRKREQKVLKSADLAAKLLELHDREDEPLNFDFTFTPLHDAMSAITQSYGHKLNKKILAINHRNRSCEFFLDHKKMRQLFDFPIKFKKCTFPKTFFFERADTRNMKIRSFRVVTEGVDGQKWLNDLMESDKIKKKSTKNFKTEQHKRRRNIVLKFRKEARKKIAGRKMGKFLLGYEDMEVTDRFLSDFEEKRDMNRIKETDEVDDGQIDALTAVIEELESNKSDKRNFVFVIPDFNLWHRTIRMQEECNKEIALLPKNFRWLLAAAANVINQEEKDVYCQLVKIEFEIAGVHQSCISHVKNKQKTVVNED